MNLICEVASEQNDRMHHKTHESCPVHYDDSLKDYRYDFNFVQTFLS